MYKVDKRFVIVGNCGLYVGQSLRRKDAITEYVGAKYGISPGDQRAILRRWHECRGDGDRAVKALIFWDYPK